ncbi:globin family protein [Tuwongella immobilis]|uniref:Uncharacterized protein n=1 Tax=Tuwongella immobilis TaxID=692036 RepID=A0A6C2YK02_9BACT|nr:hypothetical protein [Tuwongella immobilis]VIP01435.1 allophycocyanin beta subunit apoprotein : Phycocyanin OS=Isosphaera pallida (strain ATCC 43644 / DSM 9630 / IS1B) GN=Isop_2219 PE=3 SV=1: Phycobilisome [Tuwongella immobilis]VTR98397.1 allophycocyanin beta subunit apoprotein : Phycocyanin OS=Isosphaera pallida (strain ATCC 43644 / DSM 9630 / IS1B) GN=Isop_2219 PE=3 SV=1: Phycobilisome [Tuwongella immobilis]
MTPWLNEMLYSVNERFFTPAELDKVRTYVNSVTPRMRVAEEIEKMESWLERELITQLARQHPTRTCYNQRFVRDVIESMRVVVQSMLADDPRLLQYRVTDHLTALVRNLEIPAEVVAAPYHLLQTLLAEKLGVSQWGILEPYLSQITDALAVATPV